MLKKKIARIISEISNGYLTMILTPVIALLVSPLPRSNKIIFITLYTLSPILPYLVLKKMNRVSDYEFTKREERPPFFTTVTILFGAIFFALLPLANQTLILISLNIFLISAIMTIITFYWKISGHMTYSTILYVTLIFLFPNTPWLFLLFLFTPFIGWSRIALDKHTLTQVTLGTLITLAISTVIYWPFLFLSPFC